MKGTPLFRVFLKPDIYIHLANSMPDGIPCDEVDAIFPHGFNRFQDYYFGVDYELVNPIKEGSVYEDLHKITVDFDSPEVPLWWAIPFTCVEKVISRSGKEINLHSLIRLGDCQGRTFLDIKPISIY